MDEYDFSDSLKNIPENEWAFYDNLGLVKTDALYIKGDTAANQLNDKIILFFNGRDLCLLAGVTVGKYFRALGFNFLAVDYRGYGRSYGDFRPSEASTYEDGIGAIEFIRDSLGYDYSNIIVAGFSLGTGVAVEIATKYDVSGVLLFAAFTNMDNAVKTLCGGYDIQGDWVLKVTYDNVSKVISIHTPICLLSGKNDTFVTPMHSIQLFNKANEPKELHILDGQDHNRFVRESYNQWKSIVVDFALTRCSK